MARSGRSGRIRLGYGLWRTDPTLSRLVAVGRQSAHRTIRAREWPRRVDRKRQRHIRHLHAAAMLPTSCIPVAASGSNRSRSSPGLAGCFDSRTARGLSKSCSSRTVRRGRCSAGGCSIRLARRCFASACFSPAAIIIRCITKTRPFALSPSGRPNRLCGGLTTACRRQPSARTPSIITRRPGIATSSISKSRGAGWMQPKTWPRRACSSGT